MFTVVFTTLDLDKVDIITLDMEWKTDTSQVVRHYFFYFTIYENFYHLEEKCYTSQVVR